MIRTTCFYFVILIVFFVEILTLSRCSESTDPNDPDSDKLPAPEAIAWKFETAQTVLASGTDGSWDDNHVGWASIIVDKDTLKMWYSANNKKHLIWAIGYAWSLDGINWMRYSGNPVLTKAYSWEKDLGQPVVIKDGGLYRMWYHGWTEVAPVVVGYATSSDGINWTRHENPVMDLTFGSNVKTQIGLWSVIKKDGALAGWYFWTDENWNDHWTTGKACAGYATSADGISWQDHGTCLSGSGSGWDADFTIMPLVTNSDVIVNDTTFSYHMLYLGMNRDLRQPSLGYAHSQDANAWKKYENNPTATYNNLASVSGNGITLSTVIGDWPATGDFHVWYTEGPPHGTYFLKYIKGKLSVEKAEVE